jgi:hypothetical protein
MKHLMGWIVKGFAYLAIALNFMGIQGCATLFQGGSNKVSVDSKPRGASVYLDDKIQGITPLVVMVPNDSDGKIKVRLDGHKDQNIELTKTFSGWMVADLLPGTFISMPLTPIFIIVDLATCAQGHYAESSRFIEFNKELAVAPK